MIGPDTMYQSANQPPSAGQQQITPEMLQQLMELGVFDPKSQQLQDQLAMAQALRAGVGKRQYSTGVGGAFGAAGDILNTINAKREIDSVRQQQDQLLKDQSSGLGQLARLRGF